MATKNNKAPNVTTLRMDDYSRMVIDEAAKLLNLTRTGFLLSVAREHAEHVIQEKKQIRDEVECLLLSPQESLTVADLFLNPPPSNGAQKKAKAMWKQVQQG